MDYGRHVSSRQTPQSEPIIGSAQVPNSSSGFVWSVDDWTRLDRFLVLGAEGGTYYASERALTRENAEATLRCIQADGSRAVARIVEISESGRAPKNDAAVFALAMAAGLGDTATKRAALAALPRVCRIGTHLFAFCEAVQGFRGWGRGLRRAIGRWYTEQDAGRLAYQLAKYRRRNEWSHGDLLRLAHPGVTTPAHDALLRWAAGRPLDARNVPRGENGKPAVTTEYAAVNAAALPPIIAAFERLQATEDHREVIRLIAECPDLSWEMIPTEHLGHAEVWEALLPHLPMTALIRNLGRMTANGLLAPMSAAARTVAERLGDADRLRKARVHPIAVLGALATYRQGHGERGKLTWEPVAQVSEALDAAFHLAFGNVTPTGKRTLLALDVSGSMSGGTIAGMPGVTPAMGSAAMAMVTARVEPQYFVMGFANEFRSLDITARDSLTDAMRKTGDQNFGGTDCALPMVWAHDHGVAVDTFVVYTDSETWAGNIHPSQALRQYREQMGIAAKLVVVGMVSNGFTIADPNDAGMLDVVGFDTAAPQIIADFATASVGRAA